LAFVIRCEGWPNEEYLAVFAVALPAVLVAKLAALWALGVPKLAWRYSSLGEAQRIFAALAAAAVLLLALRHGTTFWTKEPLPVGVLAVDLALGFLALMGLRAAVRLWHERSDRGRLDVNGSSKIPTLLIGAGRAGALVAKEIAARPDLGLRAVGFVDDNPAKVGTVIHGIPVLGSTAHLAEIAHRAGAGQALITFGAPSAAALRRLVQLCAGCGIPAKVIPDIQEIVSGKANLLRIRNVAVEDILPRKPVRLDAAAISANVRGHRILITGAGGSIGSELCRVVCGFEPEVLVLVEKSENSLFHVHRQLLEAFPHIQLIPCVADICDTTRMEQIFESHRPDTLYHAAAHKHVPLMEGNPGEAVKNNVLGTKKLADLAHAHGLAVFVMISTDKAVNPTSVMGVSKRVAEMYIQALSQRSKTVFVAVRFGNVLGSAGSVIPIFQEQIAKGGPVTVTHPEMRRFFMTIPEACQLVLQAASMGRGGQIFILDMGQQVKIVDLARNLINLSGLVPGKDIEIRFTGMRPGEKLYEELSFKAENPAQTHHPRVLVGRLVVQDWEDINRQVEELGELATYPDCSSIHAKFREIVPEYQHGPVLVRGPVPSTRNDPSHRTAIKAGTNGVPVERPLGQAVGVLLEEATSTNGQE
jgi:FlaA1/EpsC-like NDP-sugar epimerase